MPHALALDGANRPTCGTSAFGKAGFYPAILLAACLGPDLLAMDRDPAESRAELIRRWEFHHPDDAAGWTVGNGLKDLAVVDHVLRMTITASDAYVFAPPVETPVEGCAVRVRIRGDRKGVTQVYWQTDDQPFGEPQMMWRFTTGTATGSAGSRGNGFTTVEFPIGTPADAGRTLTGFRIDPYNGNKTGTVEIEFVELLRLPPVVDFHLAPGAHRLDLGETAPLRVSLKQVAGRTTGAKFEVMLPGGRRNRIAVPPSGEGAATVDLRFDRPGVHHERALIRRATGETTHDLETSLIVGTGARLPLTPALRSDRLRLDFIPAASGKQVAAARWQIAEPGKAQASTGDWKLAGWLLPLAQLTIQRKDGRIIRRQPMMTLVEHSDRTAQLSATIDDEVDWHVKLELQFAERAGHQVIEVVATLFGPEGGRLLEFSGPTLRAERGDASDPLDRFALFGGLEFLGPNWPSSSERAIGEWFADRWSPHPFKVTIPVMAVEAAGVTSALMWQPLDKWDETEAMPTATFASPNFLDDQPNHLMRLSVPTIPRWAQENQSHARRPYVTRRDQPLTLRYLLFAEAGLPVATVCRRWYEIFGTPTPPPATHDDRTLYDLIARHYGETMYWPNESGWRHHWYLDQKSRFVPFMAAELVAHVAETGDKQWIKRTGLADKTIIDAAGTLAAQLGNDRHARRQLSAMRPDGTWPFVNTKRMRERTREFTQGKHDSLGKDGSTSLGTCVQAAMPILGYAQLTGDEKYVAASVKALEAMRQFRVPRGAQVWEVHKDIPDIRAAALAVEAYRVGYQLTGEARWLDHASYWAWTGVPFLYSWHVPIERKEGSLVASRDRDDWNRFSIPLSEGFQNPDRQVTPFATVPVLGPTFYKHSWFGVVVQWCGLEWAWKVIELDGDRPDPLLRYIADGVVASGLQQMFDRPPWVGLYPDVWDTQGNIAHGAFICAMLPTNCLQAQERVPRWAKTWTRILRDDRGKKRWHVSGWGKPISLPLPDNAPSWIATVAFPAGQPNELILAGVRSPDRVRVAGELLEPADPEDPAPAENRWRYDADHRAVVVRFRQPARTSDVRIDW